MIKKKLSLLLSCILLAVTALGCSAADSDHVKGTEVSDSAEEEEAADGKTLVVNIADFKAYPATSQIVIANEKGFLEEELAGVNAEANIVKYLNGPAINESFASDSVDLAPLGEFPAITGIANTDGQEIIALNIQDFGQSVIVKKDSGIHTISDLKGKKVGYGVGTAIQLVLQKLLENEGLSLDDISSVNLTEYADASNALLTGQIDVWMIGQPYVTTFLNENDNVETIADAENDPMLVTFVARTEFANDHPEVVIAFLKAMNDANEWIAENYDEAVSIVQKETGQDKESIEATFDNLNNTLLITDKEIDRLEYAAEYLKGEELIEEDFDIKDYIDTSFLEKIVGSN